MAANFVVVSQAREVAVLGPNQVMDVERVGFVTRPSGVYAEVPIPLVDWLTQTAAEWIGPYATEIESLINGDTVVGGEFVQDVSAQGLLVDYVEFELVYRPPGANRPPMTSGVRIPLGMLGAAGDPWIGTLPDSPTNLIAKAYDALVATANL